MRPTDWVTSLLARHNLQKTDGRPLYQYRITNAEFLDLTEMLKLSAVMGVKNITQMFFWDAAFVMYASEWWRRCYTNHWGWSGIFDSIGIDFNELSVGKRNALIEIGLQRWHRNVRYHNGSRVLLGTIATEGGLPLNQLADSGGWLKYVLQPVLRKHVSRGIDISVLIESYSDGIPDSYKSPEITQILIDIAEIVVTLRKKHQLMEKEAPLKWLDVNQPNWRELFPLPIDDEVGQSLLKDLVDTVSIINKHEDVKNPFEVERFLIRSESFAPNLVAHIEIPTFVLLDSFASDFSNKILPAIFNLDVFEPNGSIWPWCRGILTTYKEKPAIKLSGRSLKLSGIDATKELRLRFMSMGEIVHEFDIINGNYLDVELPWLFRQTDDKWILHGAASQSIKDKEALVFIPGIYSHKEDDETTKVVKNGDLFSGNIFKISGTIYCYSDDIKYKLSAGVEESTIQYYLSGNRYPYDSVPGEIFIGIPDLIETNLITGTSFRKHSQQLLAKPLAVDSDWQPLSQLNMGYYEVRLCDADGYIQLRKRIGILHSDFAFNIRPDNHKVSSGSIHIDNIKNCQINMANKDISTHIEQSNTSTEIQLETEGSPPLSVNISLLPQGQNRELLLKFPYPSKGALLFDRNGKSIPFSTQLFLSDLRGYRIKVFDEKYYLSNQVDLIFSLIDSAMKPKNLKDLYIQRKMVLNGKITEFSISNWMESINSLMSVSTSLDSSVRITMIIHGQEEFRLNIRRYENEISAYWNEGFVELDSETIKQLTNDELKEIQVSAIFLNQPEQENNNLTALNSENVLTGRWGFCPEKRQAGPWLIYPLADSRVKFRPILWNVDLSEEVFISDPEAIDSLSKAICVPDQKLRNDSIKQVLKLMAKDFKHKSWGYIDNLWQKSSHLPMATFDIWKLAINETSFLACLFIHEHNDIIEKLEIELPLIWELVYLEDWENALNLYKKKLSTNLGEEDKEYINELLRKKIKKVELLGLSMTSIGQILCNRLLGEESPELSALRQYGSDFLKPILTPWYQDLLRRQAEGEWPKILQKFINDKYKELPDDYILLLKIHHKFQNPVVYLPLLLALRVLSKNKPNWPCNATELFKIQELKRFDEDWFNSVFQLLSGWISQQEKGIVLNVD